MLSTMFQCLITCWVQCSNALSHAEYNVPMPYHMLSTMFQCLITCWVQCSSALSHAEYNVPVPYHMLSTMFQCLITCWVQCSSALSLHNTLHWVVEPYLQYSFSSRSLLFSRSSLCTVESSAFITLLTTASSSTRVSCSSRSCKEQPNH